MSTATAWQVIGGSIVMEKNILFLGGSSGQGIHQDFSDVIFSKRKNTYNYTNLSISGAGNHYISGSFFEYCHYNANPDYVFFKFTGLNRIDLPFDKKAKLYNYEYQSDATKVKYPKVFRQIEKNWVCSGGYTGSWLNQNILKRIFSYMYNVKDGNSTNLQSLAQVYNCLSLCETLNIPYNWTFYYDPTRPPSTSTIQDGHVDKIPDYIPKKNMLEISPLNYAYSIGQAPDDGNHYNHKLFRQYLKYEPVYSKIIETLGDI